MLSQDIKNYAEKRRALRERNVQRNAFGFTYRSEPSMWKDNIAVSRNAVHISKKSELFGPDWANETVPGPKYSVDESIFRTKKTAPFSRSNRFEKSNVVLHMYIYLNSNCLLHRPQIVKPRTYFSTSSSTRCIEPESNGKY